MGDLVNLRSWRKRQAKGEAEKVAAENRTRHGQSKLEKLKLKTEAVKTTKLLDGHAMTKDSDDGT